MYVQNFLYVQKYVYLQNIQTYTIGFGASGSFNESNLQSFADIGDFHISTHYSRGAILHLEYKNIETKRSGNECLLLDSCDCSRRLNS